MFTNGRGKAQGLITWSAAMLPSNERSLQVRKGESNKRKEGPEPRLGEEAPRHSLASGCTKAPGHRHYIPG